MDWASHYPAYAEPPQSSEEPIEPSTVVRKIKQDVEVADIGCGFGGLTVALAPKLPNTLILGRTRPAVTYMNNAKI
jgi:tRNA (guanine-N7-)-methyltransferase